MSDMLDDLFGDDEEEELTYLDGTPFNDDDYDYYDEPEDEEDE